jgi:hypothetical protein
VAYSRFGCGELAGLVEEVEVLLVDLAAVVVQSVVTIA